MLNRFTIVLDPTNAWFVFDELKGVPATIGGQVMIGLTFHEAETAASRENAVLRMAEAPFLLLYEPSPTPTRDRFGRLP